VRRISSYLPLLFMLPCCISLASAQSQFDLNIGFGFIHDSANSALVDQNLNTCTTGDAATPCVATSSLSAFALGFGGDLMLKKKFGIGAEVGFQPGKQTYIPNLSEVAALYGVNTFIIQSRMTLFDFNGIYQPISTKKVQLKLMAGIGGANLKFYDNTSSSSVLGSQNLSQYAQSTNHLNVHGGVGVDIFVTDHIYIRPEFDVHYVPNLNQQFGSDVVLQGMVWVGYSWGDR
jgi:hypothetical protein